MVLHLTAPNVDKATIIPPRVGFVVAKSVGNAVIRNKVADMIARVESLQAWLENITYQMTKMVRLFFFLY